MRLLSTPDSKGRYLRLGLLMLGWFILLEAILRLPPVQARIERYAHQPIWYSPYVPQRISLIRKNPDADIWFVGSSTVVLGFNPEIIDPLVNKQTSIPHKSLNLGLVGMIFVDHIENYLNDTFLPFGKPKIIVLGLFPEMFAFSTKPFRDNPIEYEQTRDHYGEWDRQVSAWLYDRLALFRFIHTFRYLISETPAPGVTNTPTGYISVDAVVDADAKPLGWEGTMGNDRLEMNLQLVQHLNDSLKARDIQLAFINTPMYDPEMRDYPGGVQNYQAYISRLSTFLGDEHIPFLDLWQALEDKYDQKLPPANFSDVAHLNANGAADISPFIADFVAKFLESTTSPSS